MKPILFNTEMVRAIQDGRKTVTRRMVKLHNNCCEFCAMKHLDVLYAVFSKGKSSGYEFVRAPYRPGDILYVRETFSKEKVNGKDIFIYKTCDENTKILQEVGGRIIKWRPSIHMPREAARIFMRVTDVRVERLQNTTEEQARAEGVEPLMMTADVDKPDGEKRWEEVLPALPRFPEVWNRTIKPADRDLYGWDANPYVWCVSFYKIPKEEALKHDQQ